MDDEKSLHVYWGMCSVPMGVLTVGTLGYISVCTWCHMAYNCSGTQDIYIEVINVQCSHIIKCKHQKKEKAY